MLYCTRLPTLPLVFCRILLILLGSYLRTLTKIVANLGRCKSRCSASMLHVLLKNKEPRSILLQHSGGIGLLVYEGVQGGFIGRAVGARYIFIACNRVTARQQDNSKITRMLDLTFIGR